MAQNRPGRHHLTSLQNETDAVARGQIAPHPATIAELNFHVLPLSLNVGGREYKERLEITTDDLFEILVDQPMMTPGGA